MTHRKRKRPGLGGTGAREQIAGQASDNQILRQHAGGCNLLLERLEQVRENGRGRWMARCPAHDDRSPSLSVREADDGTLLLHDFGGCSAADVLAAVGLELRDLFPEPVGHHRPAQRRPRRNPRDTLVAVRHALTVITLADSDLRRGEALSDDDRRALDRALAVLREAS